MPIQESLTLRARQVTYTAGRTRTTGHTDPAWALMHALQNVPLQGVMAARGSMEIF